jgi:hypothetical protein
MEMRNVEIWALRTLRSGLLYLLCGYNKHNYSDEEVE